MEPSYWVETLFTYGPYAVLALFVLWVAPRQTQQFIQCKTLNPGSRYLCGGIAVGCWMIVGLMVMYIYHAWTPRTVYTGSLGTYGEEVQFIPVHQKFFISTQLRPDGRLTWNYAIVADLGTGDESYEFTYVWGREDMEFTDYAIRPELLKRGPLRFAAKVGDPSSLLYDDDGDPETPWLPLPAIVAAHDTSQGINSWMAAYAAETPSREWIKALDSNNRYFQAQARRHMRKLSNSELQALLKTNDLSERIRRSIVREIQRRTQARR